MTVNVLVAGDASATRAAQDQEAPLLADFSNFLPPRLSGWGAS
jgi:hypothetical protein